MRTRQTARRAGQPPAEKWNYQDDNSKRNTWWCSERSGRERILNSPLSFFILTLDLSIFTVSLHKRFQSLNDLPRDRLPEGVVE